MSRSRLYRLSASRASGQGGLSARGTSDPGATHGLTVRFEHLLDLLGGGNALVGEHGHGGVIEAEEGLNFLGGLTRQFERNLTHHLVL